MASWISFILIANVMMISMTESGLIPSQPISVMLDIYGNPIMFLRDKRASMQSYPQRAMMFTGYYRPVRRSNNGHRATGVFAQGNAVSGEAFFSNMHTPHLKNGPEPIEEPEVSSSEAQAAPTLPEETYSQNEQEQEQSTEEHHQNEQEHRNHEEEEYHHQHSLTPQHRVPEQIPLTTEIARPMEEPITTTTRVPVSRPKTHNTKKTQKTPVTVDANDDYDEDNMDEDDDGPVVPFTPFKGNKRRQRYPNLNNFFPMIFSFPRMATRAGSSGSPPGTITAIANSYSTGKGGVASSVATAYGGSSTGKRRRLQKSGDNS